MRVEDAVAEAIKIKSMQAVDAESSSDGKGGDAAGDGAAPREEQQPAKAEEEKVRQETGRVPATLRLPMAATCNVQCPSKQRGEAKP